MKRSRCVTDEEGQVGRRQVDRADLLRTNGADLLRTDGADLLKTDGADLLAFWVVHRAVVVVVVAVVRRLIQ